MRKLLLTVDRYWMTVVPPERIAVVRVLVGLYATVYLWVRAPFLASYAGFHPRQFSPVGLATLLPGPVPDVVVYLSVGLTLLLAPAFFLGWRFRLTAPLFAMGLLWVLTYSNSWGQILHTDNLLVFHVLVIAVAPAADALSLDARRRGTVPPPGDRYGWGLRLMCVVTVAAYVLAGVAKLKNGGTAFIEGETLRNFIAFDNVRKIELGSIHSPVGAFLLPYAGFFALLAYLSLALELGAPVALLHRRAATAWVLAIWGFHMGVLVLMAIAFVYPMTGIAFAPFFRCERLLEWAPVRRLLAGRRVSVPTGRGSAGRGVGGS